MMPQLLIFLVIAKISLAALTPSAHAGELQSDDYSDLQSAIQAGDSAKVKLIIGKSKNPFAEKKDLLGRRTEGSTMYDHPDVMGSVMLSYATGEEKSAKLKICNKSIIETLLDAGAIPNAKHLKAASLIPCPEVIELLMSRMNDDDIALATKDFFDFMLMRYGSMSSEDQELEAEKIKSYFAVVNQFKPRVESKCSSSGKYCASKTAMEKFVAAVVAQQASEDHANSPEGLKEQGCSLQAEITEQEAAIDREKKVGKVSGVVNQAILHKAGSRIVTLREELESVQRQYRAVTKKILNLKGCGQ